MTGFVQRFSGIFIPAKTDGASCLTPWTGGRYGKAPFKSSMRVQFHSCFRAADWLCKPPQFSNMQPRRGEVAEWLKAPHSKCGIRATVSGVRILSSPPLPLCAAKCLLNQFSRKTQQRQAFQRNAESLVRSKLRRIFPPFFQGPYRGHGLQFWTESRTVSVTLYFQKEQPKILIGKCSAQGGLLGMHDHQSLRKV